MSWTTAIPRILVLGLAVWVTSCQGSSAEGTIAGEIDIDGEQRDLDLALRTRTGGNGVIAVSTYQEGDIDGFGIEVVSQEPDFTGIESLGPTSKNEVTVFHYDADRTYNASILDNGTIEINETPIDAGRIWSGTITGATATFPGTDLPDVVLVDVDFQATFTDNEINGLEM